MSSAPEDHRASVLMRSAVGLIPQGRWAEAASALEQAAVLHRQANRRYDEARSLQLAATLRRSAGDPKTARRSVERAAAAAPGDGWLAVSIGTEQALTAAAEGRHEDALAAWYAALERARRSGLKPEGLSALHRGAAASAVALGRLDAAALDYEEAFRLLEVSLGREVAQFVRLEHAALLQQHGHDRQADNALQAVEADATTLAASPHLRAELLVARAREAHAAGHRDQTVALARQAREAALLAVAPVSYFAASVELAEVLAEAGDRTHGYGILATAWATLADLLGAEVAESWVEPCLIACRIRWGRPAFERAKRDYEAGRRASADDAQP